MDFQSLASVDIEMGPLTVIVGATGSGKSAVVRALQAALFNWSGGAFVREGADKARVVIEFAETGPAGDVLRWEKPRKGGAHYFVGATEISRVGKEMPPQIAELTGIREIECEGAKAVLNFAGQFEAPFLLAGTGGQAARLLSKVARTDLIAVAQVRARRDLQARRTAADKAAEAVEGTLAQLTAMPDYEGRLVAFEALQGRLTAATERAGAVEGCRAMARDLATARATAKRLPPTLGARVRAVTEAASALSVKARLVSEAIAARSSLRAARELVVGTKQRTARAEKALADALGELRVCPICGKAMR